MEARPLNVNQEAGMVVVGTVERRISRLVVAEPDMNRCEMTR